VQITSKLDSGTTLLTLSGEVTIYGAAELKQALQQAVAGGAVVHVSLAEVTEMDTAGFQQFYLAKREANARKQTFHLIEHSAATREVLDTFGMGAYFGDPVVIPASSAGGDKPERQKRSRRTKK